MNISRVSLRTKTLLSALSFALLALRLFTPYLHDHNDSNHNGSHFVVALCPACEIESTPVMESVDPIVLPEETISQQIVSIELGITVYSPEAFSEEYLRGPPSLS